MPGVRVNVRPSSSSVSQLTGDDVEDVAAVAPVVGEVARRVLDHPDAQVADGDCLPQGLAALQTFCLMKQALHGRTCA